MASASLSSLHYAPGSRRKVKRIARGQGSGHGGTATRGHKGEGARSGTHYRPWFEGGQMPLARRVPKFGFHNPFSVKYQVVNVSTLQKLIESGKLTGGKADPALLYAAGAISKKNKPVKILGEGEISKALEITAHAFSATASKKIEAAGGKAITLSSAQK